LKLAGCFESSSSGRSLLIFERQIFLFRERYFRLARRSALREAKGPLLDTAPRQQAKTRVQILILRRLFSDRPTTFSSDCQMRANMRQVRRLVSNHISQIWRERERDP